MAKKQKEQPVLTLDGEEYFAEDMTDEQLRIGEQLTVSRESFVNMFRASLEKDDQEQPEVKEAEVVEA